MSLLDADTAIQEALEVATALPVFITGSAVAALRHNDHYAFSDVDVFCGSQNALVVAAQRFLSNGFELADRDKRVWQRWLEHGFNAWHTNSIKLTRGDVEVNCIYKLVDGHPTTSLSQVIESFDFGLLASGYDARDGILRDLRPYFFPGMDVDGPLPLLPIRRSNWRNGFLSQYQGLREVGRYVKYIDYGYDLSLVREDLIQGYSMAAEYLIGRGDPEKLQLGSIYQSLAMSIEDNEIDKLREAGAEIMWLDDLDAIMEKLE